MTEAERRLHAAPTCRIRPGGNVKSNETRNTHLDDRIDASLPRCGGGCVAARDCDSLESRVDAECPQEAADVVAHGLGAEVQLARDLSRRMASLE